MKMIHHLADVKSSSIGEGTRIWQYAVVLPGARIGCNCNFCANTFVENDVIVGDNVTVKCGVQLWDGLRVDNDVFIGPNVSFCNDRYPHSGVRDSRRVLLETRIGVGASIGAGAVILPGIKIGTHAMIGAGAVVIKDVPDFAVVVGNPARITGYVNTTNVNPVEDDFVNGAFPIGRTGAKLYRIPRFADMRGTLNVLEVEKILPFAVKRIFYTYDVNSSEVRGEHAHRQCEQFLIAVSGSLKVVVDDGDHKEEYSLTNPSCGLYLPAGCWGLQYCHSPDCVLLVLASHPYEDADYIRDYDEFLRYRKGGED